MNDRQMRMFKRAFMPLTDQAMAAQPAPMPPQGAPMDPAMAAQGGVPMDPAMMGAAPMPPQGGMPPVDPATGMPMDPAMMGAAPMPPQGAPMDPAMAAQGGAPMPPQEGMPSTGDMVIDMLLSMGAMIVDPNGQPVPPEILSQLVAEMNAQTGGMPAPGGAAPADPNSDAVLETLSQLDRSVSILTDKMDSLRAIVDELRTPAKPKENSSEAEANTMDADLQALLAEQAMAGQQAPVEEAPQPLYQPLSRPALSPEQLQQLGAMGAIQ